MSPSRRRCVLFGLQLVLMCALGQISAVQAEEAQVGATGQTATANTNRGTDNDDSEAVDAFADTEWKIPPGLKEVDLTNFEETVQGNELSVMVFYTKFSPYHRYAQRVLSNVSLEFESRSDVAGVTFCAVDLDKTPQLSTYTHFNSIDVMYFYPHLIMNGVRYAGNLTSEGVMEYTYHMYQHTTTQLQAFSQPFTDSNFETVVRHHIKPDADDLHTATNLEMHLRYQRDMLQALVDIHNSTGLLAKASNENVQTVLRFDGRVRNASDFLEARRSTELYANFLEHLYERKSLPQNGQTISNHHAAAAAEAAKQKKLDEAAAALEVEEVLF